jgi:putative nucleotidyltransferase with HDIG domain
MNLIEPILQSVTQLPPFPAVIQRALQLIEDPRSSAQQIVEVIQYDPSITANVLKLCNSAFFGLRRTVHSLKEALMFIGFNPLLEIILSLESAHLFQRSCKGYDLEDGELWRHSVGCAVLSEIVSRRLDRQPTPCLFTAALLHDIGKVLLSSFVQDYYEEIKHLTREKGLSFLDAEKEVLGINHADLGGKVIEQWKFPKTIVWAVRYHHTPHLAQEDRETIQLIHFCDLITLTTGIGAGADGLTYPVDNEVIKQYHFKEKDIEQFIIQLEERLKKVGDMLNHSSESSTIGSA